MPTGSIETVNPATGEKLARYVVQTIEDVVGVAKRAKETFY